jgi:DNA transformation protein
MVRNKLACHCLELLQPLGHARARPMFGGQGLYVDELFIGIIAFDQLYLKVDTHTRDAFEGAGGQPFTYDGGGRQVTLAYWTVPAEAMESPALMQPWARLAIDAAVRASADKPAAKRRRTAAKKSAPAATPRRPHAVPLRGKTDKPSR